MRLEIALLLWLATMSGDDDNAVMFGPMLAPPWRMAADETPMPPHSFGPCDQFVDLLTERTGGKVTERTYSKSERWGQILRVKIENDSRGAKSTSLLSCWGSDEGVQVAFEAPQFRQGK